GVEVVACDPSLPMLGYAYERLGQSDVKAEIELVHAGIGDDILENYMPEDGFDAVVCTLVLCSVSDQKAAIDTIKQYLKPNGKLYVLEHIRSNSSTGQFFQDAFNPLQKFFADGCHLNRPTDKALKSNGFQALNEDYFSKSLPFYQAILQL
ncbi:MAG: class I SAM-dependent methyltransferase, partial [Saprospiraceae bacterium]|nr:class I SAM-dependent methyltransferase [Saprospiraceae bacterium]